MRHLSEAELLDLAEGVRAESASPHLRTCDECKRQLAELREAMSAAASVEVPEPSPLFWDHFSARVRGAVAEEGMPDRGRPVGLTAIWSAIAAAAAVAAIVVSTRFPMPNRNPVPAGTQSEVASSAAVPTPVPEDAALTLVAQLAENMDYDSASELTPIDITAHPGVVEESVSGMTAGEREELGRLLSEEMRRRGI